jgi:hypothetical protein
MEQNRRNFVREAEAGSITSGAKAGTARPRGMARSLTLLTMRRYGQYRLGINTDKGILDVAEAGRLLNMFAPATIDDLLQDEDGPSLNALVDVGLTSKAAHGAFIREEEVEYGPVVTHPER